MSGRRLLPAEVQLIRDGYAAGRTQGQLAKEWEINVSTVGRIVRGESHTAAIAAKAAASNSEALFRAKLEESLALDKPPSDG